MVHAHRQLAINTVSLGAKELNFKLFIWVFGVRQGRAGLAHLAHEGGLGLAHFEAVVPFFLSMNGLES